MKKVFKILGIILILLAIAIIVLFVFFRKGFGLGAGSNTGIETAGATSIPAIFTEEEAVAENTPVAPAEQEAQEPQEETSEKIPNNIIVKISEDTVTINDQPVSNPEELKDKINEYNSDDRSFELEDDYATLDIYNWVKSVFDELEIFLRED